MAAHGTPAPAGGGTANHRPPTWTYILFPAAFILFLVLVVWIRGCQHTTNNNNSGNSAGPTQSQPEPLVETSKTFDLSSPVRVCLAGHWVARTPSGNVDITTPNGIKFAGGKSGEDFPTGWYTFTVNQKDPAKVVNITAIWYSAKNWPRECN